MKAFAPYMVILVAVLLGMTPAWFPLESLNMLNLPDTNNMRLPKINQLAFDVDPEETKPIKLSALTSDTGLIQKKRKRIHIDAIFVEPGRKIAQLNGVIVAENDRYRSYTVEKIKSDQVILAGREGRLILSLGN